MFKLLTSDRLFYRKLEEQDAKPLWDQMFHDYDKYKIYVRMTYKNFEEYLIYIKALSGGYNVNSNYLRWSIETKESNELVGNINLHNLDLDAKKAEIGCFILPKYRRSGYAKEAVDTVINFAITDLGFKTIHGYVDKGNEASSNVLLKTGFTLDSALTTDKQTAYKKNKL